MNVLNDVVGVELLWCICDIFMACIRGADRCRHYMVEMQSNGKYVILGEDRAHSSLPDLVQYHTQVGIKPFMELLMLPCGQVSVLHSAPGRLL